MKSHHIPVPGFRMQHTGAIAPRTRGGLLLTAAFACGLLTATCAQSSYQLIKVLDGALGEGVLIEGSDGKLYGTIAVGGGKGEGVVFKLNKDGSGYSVLRRLTCGGGEGSSPWAGLTEGPDGALYGTTLHSWTGTNEFGNGTVFRMNKDGTGYRVLHTFGVRENELGQRNGAPRPHASSNQGVGLIPSSSLIHRAAPASASSRAASSDR